jgi:hypothetical protein
MYALFELYLIRFEYVQADSRLLDTPLNPFISNCIVEYMDDKESIELRRIVFIG